MKTTKAQKRVRRASATRKAAKRKTYDVNTFAELFQQLGGTGRIAKLLLTTADQIEDWARHGGVARANQLAVYMSLQARGLTCHPRLFGLGHLGWRYMHRLAGPQRRSA